MTGEIVENLESALEQFSEIEEAKFYKSEKLKAEKLSNKEIMRLASRYATDHILNHKPNWRTDELYTNFFKSGYYAYPVIEASNLI